MSTTSTSSSTLTSVLSALGGSSGIDVTAAVNSVLYADRAPERVWQAQQAVLTNQTTALNQIDLQSSTVQNDLAALQDAAGALTSTSAASSNSGVLTATAVSGTPASSHTIVVNSIATTGSWYSDVETDSSSALPAGSFSITVGSTTTSIPTGSGGSNSLDELAASINGQSLGVTASIITDSSGARLSLVSTTSGASADFSVSTTSGLSFTRAATGKDASLTIDGVPISSATNTVSGAVSGVTLNLQSASPNTSVSLALSPDTADIVSAVSQFVTDYNTLVKSVNSQFSFNAATNTAGVLQEDSSIQGLQSALLSSTNYNNGAATDNTLQSLGLTVNSDGTLALNTTLLSTAVQSNSNAVTNFFQGSALNGFAASLTSALNTFTDPTEGAFSVDLTSISSEYSDLTNQTNSLELYLSSQQTLLTAKYNQADIMLQELPTELKQNEAILNPNIYNSNN